MSGGVTVSIVSHAQGELAQRLLDDLAALNVQAIEKIVVTRNVVERWNPRWTGAGATLEVIDNVHPKGFGANHNAAAREPASAYFAVLNPDLRLIADPFPALLDLFCNPSLAMVAPTIVASDGSCEDASRPLITPFEILQRRFRSRRSTTEPAWLAGMFLLVRREAFREVGGFDERYFLYCEDFDLCARMRLAGWSFGIVSEAQAVHAAQRASHRSLRHLAWHVASLFKMWSSSTFWRYRRLLIEERK